MKDRKCDICGSKLIRVVGSNVSCINGECENYINDEYDTLLVDYYDYHDVEDFDISNLPGDVESDYDEEYDEYLAFSQRNDYITRFEYRKMNGFIEDRLFKSNKIAKFKRYLDDDEIEDFPMVEEKYRIIDEGRNLELKDSEEALRHYKSYLQNPLFREDYYIYKKMVKLERDYHERLYYIISFFNSGIYCNRYHYLWFLKKLKFLKEKIDIPDEIIDECLSAFRNNGFTKKKFEEMTIPLAEKITVNQGVLKVRTDYEYTLRQFKFELKEEASQLNNAGQIRHSIEILENLIVHHGFRTTQFFESICHNYHRLGDYENELKWIYGYFNRGKRFKNKNDWKFLKRLDDLDIETSDFVHESMFFDTNQYYLTKDDFKANAMGQFDMLDYIILVKEKYSMIQKGLELENSNPWDAIDYYNSILDHELFINDYYVYKALFVLYSRENLLEESLNTIISFFNSGIYCDRYNYLFFLFNLKKLSQVFIIDNEEIDGCLKSFREKSFKNRHLENTPAPLAERLSFNKNELKIIQAEEFDAQQELGALGLEAELYGSCSMLYSENRVLETMIVEYGIEGIELYEQICFNYHDMNDIENEKRIINDYLNRIDSWNFNDKKWFEDRLVQLENYRVSSGPLKEPDFEIFFENNDNYLTHTDFMAAKKGLTELLDRCIQKFKLRREGWRLERNDYQRAIEFYKSLLDCYLFKDDYYVYRKLVLLYVKTNEFELVWQTIISFFHSGIYCNRYQYIWFLHKVEDVSRVMHISDDEITECLKFFHENGFRNRNMENSAMILAERLYQYRHSLKINNSEIYNRAQKKYELKEEAGQLELNGSGEESIEILRDMIDKGCNKSPRDYMRLCHRYREDNDYENEREIIIKYLSNERNKYSREWFEKRFEEVNDILDNEDSNN